MRWRHAWMASHAWLSRCVRWHCGHSPLLAMCCAGSALLCLHTVLPTHLHTCTCEELTHHLCTHTRLQAFRCKVCAYTAERRRPECAAHSYAVERVEVRRGVPVCMYLHSCLHESMCACGGLSVHMLQQLLLLVALPGVAMHS